MPCNPCLNESSRVCLFTKFGAQSSVWVQVTLKSHFDERIFLWCIGHFFSAGLFLTRHKIVQRKKMSYRCHRKTFYVPKNVPYTTQKNVLCAKNDCDSVNNCNSNANSMKWESSSTFARPVGWTDVWALMISLRVCICSSVVFFLITKTLWIHSTQRV